MDQMKPIRVAPWVLAACIAVVGPMANAQTATPPATTPPAAAPAPPAATTPAPPAFDESALVAHARAGDTQAFSDLVKQYERKIYRLAKHITQNDEDAEDVKQQALSPG